MKSPLESNRNFLRRQFKNYDKNIVAKALFAGMSVSASILEGATPGNFVDLGRQFSKSTNQGRLLRDAAARLARNTRQGMSLIDSAKFMGHVSTAFAALDHVTDLVSTGSVNVPALSRDVLAAAVGRLIGGGLMTITMLPGEITKTAMVSSDTKNYISLGLPLEIKIEAIQSLQDEIFDAFREGGPCAGY